MIRIGKGIEGIRSFLHKLAESWQALPQSRRRLLGLAFSGLILLVGFGVLFGLRAEFVTPQGSIRKKVLLSAAGSVLLWVLAPHVQNRLKEQTNIVINVLAVIFLPLVLFFAMQLLLGLPLKQILVIRFLRVCLNLLVMYLLEGLVYGLTMNVRLALGVNSAVMILFTVVNIYLLRFRQVPLLYSDLSVLGTAGNVAKSYDYTPDLSVVLALFLLIDILVAASKLQKHKDVLKKTWLFRLVFTAGALICWAGFVRVMIYSDFLANNHIGVNTFRPIKTYNTNGGILTFVRSINMSVVKAPEGYTEERIKELEQAYPSDKAKDPGQTPNVIVIMDEAFADLQSVGSFRTNEPVMPFYNSLREDAIKGMAYVSVFGGKTANSEFEFLTGDTNAFLPAGATPYQIFIRDYVPSLTAYCRAKGYQGNLAMHPFLGNGYNRNAVYGYLGFERFITQEDFAKDADRVREFISDREDVSRIIREYETAKGKSDAPFYLFNVTMQNHSPYDRDFDNLPGDIVIQDQGLADPAAQRYLNLIHLSDQALKQLVTYFKEKKDDPTVIVFFGDHEPGLSDSFYQKLLGKKLNDMTPEESMEMYRVPYLVWANFDIEEREDETTSLNYLRAQMLQTAGMSLTGYDRYLLKLSEKIPAITANGYFGDNGKYYKVEDASSPYYKSVEEYRTLQYDHLFGGKHRSGLFELED